MVINDIKYLKSFNPIEFLNKPAKETLEYLPKLLENSNFIDFVKQMRIYYKFPEKRGNPKSRVLELFNQQRRNRFNTIQ